MSQKAKAVQPKEVDEAQTVLVSTEEGAAQLCETEVLAFKEDKEQEVEVVVETDACIEVEETADGEPQEEEDEDEEEEGMTYEGICNEFVKEELCETVHSDEEEGEEYVEAHGEMEAAEGGDENDDDDDDDGKEIEFVEVLEEDFDKEYSCGCKQLSTPTATYTCDICDDKNTTEYIIQAQPKVTATKKYVCTHCNKSFISNTLFTKHMNAHLCKKIYICKFCNELFTSNVVFIKHVKQHERNEEELEDGKYQKVKCKLKY